jgi:hypothetical protein
VAKQNVLTDFYNCHLRPDQRWVACCPGCGWELAEAWREDQAAFKASRLTCPVCVGAA